MNIIRCASESGGKDSTATAIIMLDEHPHDECRMVFADTGNEQQQTLDYVHDYLPNALGMQIDAGPCCKGLPILDIARFPTEQAAIAAYPAMVRARDRAIQAQIERMENAA